MARVWVDGGQIENGKITSLRVQLGELPARSIDRDTAIAWLRDGHSFITRQGQRALQIVERAEGEEPPFVIRPDNAPEADDALPL